MENKTLLLHNEIYWINLLNTIDYNNESNSRTVSAWKPGMLGVPVCVCILLETTGSSKHRLIRSSNSYFLISSIAVFYFLRYHFVINYFTTIKTRKEWCDFLKLIAYVPSVCNYSGTKEYMMPVHCFASLIYRKLLRNYSYSDLCLSIEAPLAQRTKFQLRLGRWLVGFYFILIILFIDFSFNGNEFHSVDETRTS